jgi:hypothetical protein
VDTVKLVTEYLLDAVKFERMAEEANEPELRAAFQKQAADYRMLAIKRAKDLGLPPPDIPSSVRDN